jgi:hypothetical protein
MVDALEYFLNKLAAISTPVWDRLNPKTVFIGSYQDEQNTVNCTTLSLAIVKETKKIYFFYKNGSGVRTFTKLLQNYF